MVKRVSRYVLSCVRCGHTWQTRGEGLPKKCPKCFMPWKELPKPVGNPQWRAKKAAREAKNA